MLQRRKEKAMGPLLKREGSRQGGPESSLAAHDPQLEFLVLQDVEHVAERHAACRFVIVSADGKGFFFDLAGGLLIGDRSRKVTDLGHGERQLLVMVLYIKARLHGFRNVACTTGGGSITPFPGFRARGS